MRLRTKPARFSEGVNRVRIKLPAVLVRIATEDKIRSALASRGVAGKARSVADIVPVEIGRESLRTIGE
jgi:hypothetical protein